MGYLHTPRGSARHYGIGDDTAPAAALPTCSQSLPVGAQCEPDGTEIEMPPMYVGTPSPPEDIVALVKSWFTPSSSSTATTPITTVMTATGPAAAVAAPAMSTTTKLVIGAAAVGALYLLFRKKKNPSRPRRNDDWPERAKKLDAASWGPGGAYGSGKMKAPKTRQGVRDLRTGAYVIRTKERRGKHGGSW